MADGASILLLEPDAPILRQHLLEQLAIDRLKMERPGHELIAYLNTTDPENPWAAAIAIPKAALANAPAWFAPGNPVVHAMRGDQLEEVIRRECDGELTDPELRARYRALCRPIPEAERRRRGWLDDDPDR